MKILIADDHRVLRQGLRQVLSDEFPSAEFGEASTTSEVLDLVARDRWDIVILDIFMPGRSGLEVLFDLRTQLPDLPVLVLSSAPEEQLAVRVLRAGAKGYLNKMVAPEELVGAVRKVLAGGRYVSGPVAERLAVDLIRNVQPGFEALSDREFTVLQFVVAGKSLKEIAAELALSVKTVSTYHVRIWEKLGVHSDVDLVHYAIEKGLVGKRSG